MKTIERKIPYALPFIDEKEINEVINSIQSNWLSKGPKTIKFEKEFAQYVNSEYAIGLNSCTAGLHLAQLALGIGPGDEVITTPYTFAATVNTIIHTGATPVLADIDYTTFNIDPLKIEEKITDKTKAIIPVHFAGYPCDMKAIKEIAVKHKLYIIEDAAHAIYTKYHDEMIGSISDITCFSFYATKNLVTGEGGMVTTNNEEIADRIRIMSLHGMNRNAWNRYSGNGSWYYEITEAGYKYNMTDIQAAFGLVQLKKLERFQERRTEIAKIYNEEFNQIKGFTLPYHDSTHRHAWHLYVLRIDENCFTIDRGQFIEELDNRGIGTSVHFIPIPTHPYYRKMGYEIEDFPQAEKAYNGAISLPLYPRMSNDEVYQVVEAVKNVAEKFRR